MQTKIGKIDSSSALAVKIIESLSEKDLFLTQNGKRNGAQLDLLSRKHWNYSKSLTQAFLRTSMGNHNP